MFASLLKTNVAGDGINSSCPSFTFIASCANTQHRQIDELELENEEIHKFAHRRCGAPGCVPCAVSIGIRDLCRFLFLLSPPSRPVSLVSTLSLATEQQSQSV